MDEEIRGLERNVSGLGHVAYEDAKPLLVAYARAGRLDGISAVLRLKPLILYVSDTFATFGWGWIDAAVTAAGVAEAPDVPLRARLLYGLDERPADAVAAPECLHPPGVVRGDAGWLRGLTTNKSFRLRWNRNGVAPPQSRVRLMIEAELDGEAALAAI